jgi:dienelactone hydrolase
MSRGTWINHFENNLAWSNATLVCKGMAPYQAVCIGEIDRIGENLKAREAEPHAWWEEWCAMAAHVEKMADEAAAKGRDLTAGHYYLRAGNYYYTGERFIPPGEQKLGTYRKALRCYWAGLQRRYPKIERVDFPYDGTTLPAYFLPAEGATGPAPTVVLFDGLDNCKEMSIVFGGTEFARRGFNTLSVDGPGQAEALRLQNLPYRHDYELAGRAAYDYVASRADVDRSKVVVMGYSFGGYCAPRVAGLDQRYAGCVAFGAMYWDMAQWLRDREARLDDRRTSATTSFQLPWALGVRDTAEALEKIKHFSLEGIASKVQCPFLAVHGENDQLTPPALAEKLYAEIGAKNKTLKIFTGEEGGAEHCQVDDRPAGIDFIADWIAENVVRAKA